MPTWITYPHLRPLETTKDAELRFKFGARYLQLAWLVLSESGRPLRDADIEFAVRVAEPDPNPKYPTKRYWKPSVTDAHGRFRLPWTYAPPMALVLEVRFHRTLSRAERKRLGKEASPPPRAHCSARS
jgi:hypothetical protein